MQSSEDLVSAGRSPADAAKSTLVPVAIGAGVLVLIIAFLIGKRVGTTRSTVVEIRRI